jgi:hypothetical protein
MIHLYAVVRGLAELPDSSGIGDSALERLEVEGFEVVFGDVGAELMQATEEAVIRHALVVEELLACSDAVLPGRLGRGFSDVDELAQSVRAQADRLERALRRVEGCVELGLRVLEPATESPSAVGQNGADYLTGRLARKRELERRALELHEPLSRVAQASARREGRLPGEVLEAAYLLPADDVDRFRDELSRLERSQNGLDFVCTGPWPPYTFAAEEGV